MTPFDEAKRVYDGEPCARTFQEDLELHFRSGFVFSTPDYFVMGRPVDSSAPHADIVNPWITYPRGAQDCWHVYLMAGQIAKAWAILPYPLPMFSLERRNELRFYKFSDIARHAPLIHA